MISYGVRSSLITSIADSYRSAFGKLGQLNKKIQSMELLYLWQQQEASYSMLRDFSGRPNDSTNGDSAAEDDVDLEPEM